MEDLHVTDFHSPRAQDVYGRALHHISTDNLNAKDPSGDPCVAFGQHQRFFYVEAEDRYLPVTKEYCETRGFFVGISEAPLRWWMPMRPDLPAKPNFSLKVVINSKHRNFEMSTGMTLTVSAKVVRAEQMASLVPCAGPRGPVPWQPQPAESTFKAPSKETQWLSFAGVTCRTMSRNFLEDEYDGRAVFDFVFPDLRFTSAGKDAVQVLFVVGAPLCVAVLYTPPTCVIKDVKHSYEWALTRLHWINPVGEYLYSTDLDTRNEKVAKKNFKGGCSKASSHLPEAANTTTSTLLEGVSLSLATEWTPSVPSDASGGPFPGGIHHQDLYGIRKVSCGRVGSVLHGSGHIPHSVTPISYPQPLPSHEATNLGMRVDPMMMPGQGCPSRRHTGRGHTGDRDPHTDRAPHGDARPQLHAGHGGRTHGRHGSPGGRPYPYDREDASRGMYDSRR